MAPYNPPNSHYSCVDVSNYEDSMILCMVGKGGKGFYNITNWLKLDYVWFDSENKKIELWGPYDSLKAGAKQKLETSLYNFSKKYTVKNID